MQRSGLGNKPDKSENILESLDKCLGGDAKFLISNFSHDFLFFMIGFQE
jgi:hypothetical protein